MYLRYRLSSEVRELLSVLILTVVPYIFWTAQTYALNLSNRSVTISTAQPSALANHDFQLTISSQGIIGSIVFQYCSNSPLFETGCVAPAGLSLSHASLTNQTGNTGFNIDSTASNANTLVIGRNPNTASLTPSNYNFTNIINPSINNQTTYVRITTYSSTDGSGNYIDRGAVAFTTNYNFVVGAYVPPFLNLCVGVTVAQDCSQSQGNSLDMGVLSSQSTGMATSQYAGSTNNVNGFTVYVLGSTMTSGNNIIQAINNQSTSKLGSDEFGLNLQKNTNPNVGNEPSGDGASSPSAGYNQANLYSFVPGSQISSSTESTDYNRMTVSYIANVPSSQPPGVYSTTLTYLASTQF
jgi:hypothetical protein